MINKLVKIETIYGEEILCIILEENKYQYRFRSSFGKGYIPKDEVKDIIIVGEVK